MEELRKMNKIIDREFPEAYRDIGCSGCNNRTECPAAGEGIQRCGRDYRDRFDKDGWNRKGGIAVAIHAELGVPVKYIGVGETIDDLQKFNADDFVNALFERPKDDEASEEVSENE